MSMSILPLILSAALIAPQDPPRPTAEPETTQVEDVEVIGRLDRADLETRIDDFVDSVAAPIGDFGPARWNRRFPLCVGAVNFQPAAAQQIVDRVAAVALELGIRPGDPGCKPHVLVFATNDGAGMATALVERDPRLFSGGGSGMDLGRGALEDFQSGERVVRWWHVSVPVDADTGQRATRRATDGMLASTGDPTQTNQNPENVSLKFAASRLTRQARDDMRNVVIIVDTDELGELSFDQVADHVAFVALAQVDPTVAVVGHASILAAPARPDAAPGLTDWDMAYLHGLYRARLDRVSQNALLGAVERSMEIHHRTASAGTDAEN